MKMIKKSAIRSVSTLLSLNREVCICGVVRRSRPRGRPPPPITTTAYHHQIRIMKELQHPNLVKLHDVWHGPEHVVLVLERYDRDLFVSSDAYGSGMPEESVVKIFTAGNK